MSRQIICTNNAPPSPATYSQAVKAAGLIFVSASTSGCETTGTHPRLAGIHSCRGQSVSVRQRQPAATVATPLGSDIMF